MGRGQVLDRGQDRADASNALGRRGLDVGRPLRPEIDRDQQGGRRDQAPGRPAPRVGEPQGDERREGRGAEQGVRPDRPPRAQRHDGGGAQGQREGGEQGDVPGHPRAAPGPCLATGEGLQAHRGEHGHRQRGEHPRAIRIAEQPVPGDEREQDLEAAPLSGGDQRRSRAHEKQRTQACGPPGQRHRHDRQGQRQQADVRRLLPVVHAAPVGSPPAPEVGREQHRPSPRADAPPSRVGDGGGGGARRMREPQHEGHQRGGRRERRDRQRAADQKRAAGQMPPHRSSADGPADGQQSHGHPAIERHLGMPGEDRAAEAEAGQSHPCEARAAAIRGEAAHRRPHDPRQRRGARVVAEVDMPHDQEPAEGIHGAREPPAAPPVDPGAGHPGSARGGGDEVQRQDDDRRPPRLQPPEEHGPRMPRRRL